MSGATILQRAAFLCEERVPPVVQATETGQGTGPKRPIEFGSPDPSNTPLNGMPVPRRRTRCRSMPLDRLEYMWRAHASDENVFKRELVESRPLVEIARGILADPAAAQALPSTGGYDRPSHRRCSGTLLRLIARACIDGGGLAGLVARAGLGLLRTPASPTRSRQTARRYRWRKRRWRPGRTWSAVEAGLVLLAISSAPDAGAQAPRPSNGVDGNRPPRTAERPYPEPQDRLGGRGPPAGRPTRKTSWTVSIVPRPCSRRGWAGAVHRANVLRRPVSTALARGSRWMYWTTCRCFGNRR